MSTYNWNGSAFSPDITTQIVADPEGNLYLYQYQYGLYPCSLDSNNNPTYQGSLQYAVSFISAGIQFTSTSYNTSQINAVSSQILNGQLNNFTSSSNNVVNLTTQTPSSLVSTTITQAVSAVGTSEAISEVAPVLNDLPFNFGIQNLLNANNGQQLLTQLSNALSNHQNILLGTQKAISAISDFKKKIIRKQTLIADSLSMIQTSTTTMAASGTFGALESTFGGNFTNLNNVLNNASSQAASQLSGLLPSKLGGGNIEGTIQNAISKVFGGSNSNGVPNIINPIDKFVVDLQDLENPAASFLTNLANQGFSTIESQLDFVNQALNVVNNVISKLPVTSTISIPGASTNPIAINNALTSYYGSLFTSSISGSTTPITTTQQANNNLLALMAITGPTSTNTVPATAANYDPTDPSQGGTLFGTSVLSSIFGSENDPSVSAPNVGLSSDPSIQANQLLQNVEQQVANQPGISNITPHGSGFNIFQEVDLRPRNNPVNGTTGDYEINEIIPI